MNLHTPGRLLRALRTPAGRQHYRDAFRSRLWQSLGSLPWDLDVRARLAGQLPMVLSTRDQVISRAIFATGEWEPDELAILRHFVKPGMTAFDVGANIGVHSLTLAQLVGPHGAVHSFEPTHVFARLQKNVDINGFAARIRLNHCAVGATKGTMRLVATKPGAELFSSRSTPLDPSVGTAQFLEFPMITLDEYCAEKGIERIDFLKVDVEGGEPEVLAGAVSLLARGAIRCVLFEFSEPCLVNCGESPEKLLASIRNSGFQLRFLDRSGRFHDHLDSLQGLTLNVLALPEGEPIGLPTLQAILDS